MLRILTQCFSHLRFPDTLISHCYLHHVCDNSYAEAHKIKLKADALEAWELEKWHSQRQQDLLMKEGKFKHVKQQELIALQKRIQTGREEQKKQRHQDLERYVFVVVVLNIFSTTSELITHHQ